MNFIPFITYLLGPFNNIFIALLLFVSLAFISSIMVDIIKKELTYNKVIKLLFKKIAIFIIIIISVAIDRMLLDNDSFVRTLCCHFYFIMEVMIIIENAKKLGISIPDQLVEIIEKLKTNNTK